MAAEPSNRGPQGPKWLEWRGTWQLEHGPGPGGAYQLGDGVVYQNRLYRGLRDTFVEPSVGPDGLSAAPDDWLAVVDGSGAAEDRQAVEEIKGQIDEAHEDITEKTQTVSEKSDRVDEQYQPTLDAQADVASRYQPMIDAAGQATAARDTVLPTAAQVAVNAEVVQQAVVDAQAARDASVVNAQTYIDEPTGRAAIAAGPGSGTYDVQGSGDTATRRYRFVNAGTPGTLIVTFPSKGYVDSVGTRTTSLEAAPRTSQMLRFLFRKSRPYANGTIFDVDGNLKLISVDPIQRLNELDQSIATAPTAQALVRILFRSTVYAEGTIFETDGSGKLITALQPGSGGGGGGGGSGNITTGPGRSYDYAVYDGVGAVPIIGSSSRSSVNTSAKLALTRPVVYMILQLGQSLSIGGTSNDAHAYSTTPRYPSNVLMFNNGLINATTTPTGFVPAVEAVSGSSGESGLVTCMNRLYELVKAAHPTLDPIFLGTIQGAGGTPLENFMRGSSRGKLLPSQVAAARSICNALGWDLVVLGIRLIHGNQNYTISGKGRYASVQRMVVEQLSEDIRYINNQQPDAIRIWADQPDSFLTTGINSVFNGIIEAQNYRQWTGANMWPGYNHTHIPRDNGGGGPTHPSSLGYSWIGEGDAYVIFDTCFGTGRFPFQPDRAYFVADDTIEYQTYVPVPPLVATNPYGYVTAISGNGKGHEVLNPYDLNSLAISSVTVVDGGSMTYTDSVTFSHTPARVQIKLASAPARRPVIVCHAMRGSGAKDGPVEGARTYMFDSNQAVGYWGTDGNVATGGNSFHLAQPMDRWALLAS